MFHPYFMQKNHSIRRTSDGDYIIAGTKTMEATKGNRAVAWLIKTNEEGDLIWDKPLYDIEGSHGGYVEQTTDGGYILAGNVVTERSESGSLGVLIAKIDPEGQLLWQRNYNSSEKETEENPVSIQQTNDGGYILAGNITEGETPGPAFFMKADPSGNLAWKIFLSKTSLCTAQQTSDGNYILAGNNYSNVLPQDIQGGGAWLAKCKDK